MIGFISILSIVFLVIFIYKYFKRSEKVYVSDRRYKSGVRYSHSRNFTEDELAIRKKKYLKYIKITGGVFLLSFLAGLIFEKDNRQKDIKSYSYEIINSTENDLLENHYILLKSNDYSKDSIEKILREIKTEICKKQCNISAYDDKQVYGLEDEMKSKKEMLGLQFSNQKITKAKYQKELNLIDKKYYIKVAEHLVGYLEFEKEGVFLYYPYKDWKYKELLKAK